MKNRWKSMYLWGVPPPIDPERFPESFKVIFGFWGSPPPHQLNFQEKSWCMQTGGGTPPHQNGAREGMIPCIGAPSTPILTSFLHHFWWFFYINRYFGLQIRILREISSPTVLEKLIFMALSILCICSNQNVSESYLKPYLAKFKQCLNRFKQA